MKELDLTKLLKVGDKIYSTLLGDCKVIGIDPNFLYPIVIGLDKDIKKVYGHLDKYGRYYTKGECQIFPSKEIRTWEGYKPSIPDKALVWAWDNNDNFERILTFYDAKNRCTFLPASGQREGCRFDNYELYEGEEPEWATEARKNLSE